MTRSGCSCLPRTGTLARVALTGGAPREILDDVIAADWSAGAASSPLSAGTGSSFPSATPFTDGTSSGTSGSRRTARDSRSPTGRSIVVLDRSGQKTTLSSGWGDMITLAWSPSGDEVWFTADRRRQRCFRLDVARLSRSTARSACFSRPPGQCWPILDVFRDGRALVATHVARMGCSCVPPGEVQPTGALLARWLRARGALADGGSVLFSEMLRGAGKNGSIYLRKTDGSDAIRLGDGYGEDLSPDGKWVLATAGRNPAALDHHADRAWIAEDSPARTTGGALRGQLSAQRTSDRVRRKGEGSRRAHLCPGHRRRIDSRRSLRRMSEQNGLATPTAAMSSGRTKEGTCSSLPSTAAHRSR